MDHRSLGFPPVPLSIVATVTVSVLAIAGCGTAPATAPVADQSLAGSGLQSASTLAASGLDVGDEPSALGGPARGSLGALWPNDDGHFWSYRLNLVENGLTLPHYYDTKEAVPPTPSALELAEWLQRHRRAVPTGHGSASGTWTLRFEGRGTTLSGATGQNLTETLIPDAGPRLSTVSSKQAFLALLARARPDLAPALRRRFPEIEATSVDLYPPILLHGYIWEKTAEHIGTYGDLDLKLAWKFLEADISPGHEFTFQLVPLLADDIFLHALVLPARYETHPRLVPGQVEVLYVIDFGVSTGTDSGGHFVGFFNLYLYGTVTYFPLVGPVAGVEYNLVDVGGSPAEPFELKSFKLLESGPGLPAGSIDNRSDFVSARR